MSGEKRPPSETGPSGDPGSGPSCPKCRARTDRDEGFCARCGVPLEYGSVPQTSRDLYGVLIVATMTAAVAFWLSPRMGTEQAFGFIVVPVYFILAVVTVKLRFDRKRFHCPRCGWVHRGAWDTRPWIMVGILLVILMILLILLVLER